MDTEKGIKASRDLPSFTVHGHASVNRSTSKSRRPISKPAISKKRKYTAFRSQKPLESTPKENFESSNSLKKDLFHEKNLREIHGSLKKLKLTDPASTKPKPFGMISDALFDHKEKGGTSKKMKNPGNPFFIHGSKGHQSEALPLQLVEQEEQQTPSKLAQPAAISPTSEQAMEELRLNEKGGLLKMPSLRRISEERQTPNSPSKRMESPSKLTNPLLSDAPPRISTPSMTFFKEDRVQISSVKKHLQLSPFGPLFDQISEQEKITGLRAFPNLDSLPDRSTSPKSEGGHQEEDVHLSTSLIGDALSFSNFNLDHALMEDSLPFEAEFSSIVQPPLLLGVPTDDSEFSVFEQLDQPPTRGETKIFSNSQSLEQAQDQEMRIFETTSSPQPTLIVPEKALTNLEVLDSAVRPAELAQEDGLDESLAPSEVNKAFLLDYSEQLSTLSNPGRKSSKQKEQGNQADQEMNGYGVMLLEKLTEELGGRY